MNRAAAFSLLVLFSPFALTAQSSSPKADTPAVGAANGTPALHEKQSFMGTPPMAVSINKGDSRVFAMSRPGPKAFPGQLVAGCPIDLQAQRRGNETLMFVNRSRYDVIVSPRLHLIFANWQPREVVAVSVTVHGYNLAPRFLPTDYRSNDSLKLTLKVDLKFNDPYGMETETETDITLRSFASISRIDLNSVDYLDGTSWNTSDRQSCHIVPDEFMLASSR
jgi:hypothetical protein